MQGPLVSIVVPVFNRAKVVGETIESVLAQDYTNWELIMVDDNSTDNSLEVLESYSRRDGRVRIVPRKPGSSGAPACRNTGLENAKGDWILFLDSDDLLVPGTLSGRVQYLIEHPGLDFIVNPSAFFAEKISDAKVAWNRFDDRQDLDRFLSYDIVWPITGPTWSKAFLNKAGLRFEESALSSQDWEFHTRALATLPRYHKLEGLPDLFIRRHADVPNISMGHSGAEKSINRLGIIGSFFQLKAIRENPERKERLLFVYILEAVRLMATGQMVPEVVYRKAKVEATPGMRKIRRIIKFFRTSYRLNKIHPLLYKVYRKLRLGAMVDESVMGKKLYRTPLTPVEIAAIASLEEKGKAALK